VTLASKFSLGGGLTTFTVSHYDPSFDEGPSAARTAALLKTNHREKKITSAEYTDDILEVLTRIDEPIADPGAIASFMVTKHAAEFVKVVVTGNGGDEFFYGYEPYLRYGLARLLSSMPSFLRDDVFPSMLKLVPGDFGYMGMALKAGIFLEGLKYPEHLRNTAWLAAFPPDECPDALHPLVKQNCAEFIKDTGMFFMNLYGKYSGCGSLERLAADFQSVYLPDSICAHTDKTSMMHSIEARSPFLDNELTSFANNLPEKWKLNGGVSKYALRLLIKRHLGRTPVINGPKRGFTVPVAKLLRGPLLDQAELYFSDEICDYCGIFNNEYVSRIWHDHKTGRKNHYRKLWTIFTLHHWIKTNIL
jgi:asparagine synthase (glutamine-hydrolysing)